MLYPIIPSSSLKVLNIFNINEKDINFKSIIDNEYLIKTAEECMRKLKKAEVLLKEIQMVTDGYFKERIKDDKHRRIRPKSNTNG